ncbi:MAG: hypothetical protein EOM30_01515 [Clostridia bacterium]|nr:hypothetical protein [Clostridia bacterium]
MSYDVSFKAKLDGAEQWVYVGDDWINHTCNTSAMIKEVCGSYPSDWNGKSCEELIPVLDAGVTELMRYSQRYRQFEPSNGWGTVETTIEFLSNILKNCKMYPTAVIEIN